MLTQGILDDFLEDSRSKLDQLVREQRSKEREKSREIGDELKRMCEGGVASLDEVESRRKEFLSELEKTRTEAEVRVQGCSLIGILLIPAANNDIGGASGVLTSY